jgi:hypothetical protein
MSIAAPELKTDRQVDPQALIEEARRRQRRRARRRNILLGALAALLVAGFGVARLIGGGGAVHAAGPAAAASTSAARTVSYQKTVTRKIVPGLPNETSTTETWSPSNDSSTNRQVVVTAGGKRLEIATTPAHAKILGAEQSSYLFDPSTNTIYRTGYITASAVTPDEQFEQLLAELGVRVAGTGSYLGRSVYVVEARPAPAGKVTYYIDRHTHAILMSDIRTVDLRLITRTVAYKLLPATKANLALTSLTGTHPGARVVLHASPRIRALYGAAAFPSGNHA